MLTRSKQVGCRLRPHRGRVRDTYKRDALVEAKIVPPPRTASFSHLLLSADAF